MKPLPNLKPRGAESDAQARSYRWRSAVALGLVCLGAAGLAVGQELPLAVLQVAALADRMQQLADDPALQRSMSAAALERVKRLGGWDHYGDLWDTLLHTLTGLPADRASAT